jgi:hypothetical protein
MTDEEHLKELRRCYELMLAMPRPQPHRAVKVLDLIVKLERRIKRRKK